MARENNALRAANEALRQRDNNPFLGLDAMADKLIGAVIAFVALAGLTLAAAAVLGWLDRWLDPVFRWLGWL